MTEPTNQEILAAHEFYSNTSRAKRFNPDYQWTKAYRHKERHILHFPQDQLRHFLRWRPDARRGKECRAGDKTFLTVFMVDIANQIGFQNVEDAYQALKRFVKTNAWFEDRRELRWLVEYASIHPVSDTPDEAARFAHHVDALNDLGGGKLPSPASTIAAWDQERHYESLTPQLMFTLTDDPDWRWRARARYRDTELEMTNDDALRFARAALRILDECTDREHGTTFAHHVLGRRTLAHLRNPLREIATINIRESPRRITTFPAKRIVAYRRLVRNAYSLVAHPIDQGWGRHADPPEPDPDLPQGAVKQLQEAGRAIHADVHARTRTATRTRTITKKSASAKKLAAKRTRAPVPQPAPPTPSRPQVRVAVNPTTLEELEVSSATLRERLISDQHLEPNTPLEPTPAPEAPSTEAGETLPSIQALGIDDEDYQALLETLAPHELRAVTTLARRDPAPLKAIARDAGILLSVLIDNINEQSLEHVGDILIDASAEPPELIEEHALILAPLATADATA